MHWAAFASCEHAISYMLAWGADPNIQDIKGLTSLHLAVKTSEDILTSRSVRALLLKGADVNMKDFNGKTPLDYVDDF